jgi:hypothetical protein
VRFRPRVCPRERLRLRARFRDRFAVAALRLRRFRVVDFRRRFRLGAVVAALRLRRRRDLALDLAMNRPPGPRFRLRAWDMSRERRPDTNRPALRLRFRGILLLLVMTRRAGRFRALVRWLRRALRRAAEDLRVRELRATFRACAAAAAPESLRLRFLVGSDGPPAAR